VSSTVVASGGLLASGSASFNVTALVDASATYEVLGYSTPQASVTITIDAEKLGELWSTVPDGNEVWSEVLGEGETWTEASSDNESWSVISAGSETWTEAGSNNETWVTL
jgi:hypothetical protein